MVPILLFPVLSGRRGDRLEMFRSGDLRRHGSPGPRCPSFEIRTKSIFVRFIDFSKVSDVDDLDNVSVRAEQVTKVKGIPTPGTP